MSNEKENKSINQSINQLYVGMNLTRNAAVSRRPFLSFESNFSRIPPGRYSGWTSFAVVIMTKYQIGSLNAAAQRGRSAKDFGKFTEIHEKLNIASQYRKCSREGFRYDTRCCYAENADSNNNHLDTVVELRSPMQWFPTFSVLGTLGGLHKFSKPSRNSIRNYDLEQWKKGNFCLYSLESGIFDVQVTRCHSR